MSARLTEWVGILSRMPPTPRAEIWAKYGNEPAPIAYVPAAYLAGFSAPPPDNRVYSGLAYFLDHALNHHADLAASDFLHIQEILGAPDEVIVDRRDDRGGKPRDNLLFVKEIGKDFLLAISLHTASGGKLLLHKSLHNTKKNPYPRLPRIRGLSLVDGSPTIGRIAETIPGGCLPARSDLTEIVTAASPAVKSDIAEKKYAVVAVEAPLTTLYHYRIPENLRGAVLPGSRVFAPFGGRKIRGFCVEITADCPVAAARVRDLLAAGPEGEIVSAELLKLTRWAADYYHCGWGAMLAAAVPAGVRKNQQVREYFFVRRAAPTAELSAFKQTVRANAKGQLAVCDFFLRNSVEPSPEFSQSALCAELGVTAATLKPLVEKKLLAVAAKKYARPPTTVITPAAKNIALTDEQQTALTKITAALDAGKFAPFLLYGITGSGKTEVYLRAMRRALDQHKTVLILVPEISLTPQTVGRFQLVAGEVVSLHSHLADSERAEAWRRLCAGEVRVVVGARSAVFSPLPNLGLIIVDEEHEHTFKQESYPRYHGRDVAVMRASAENAVVILGSATPSLESWHNARRGKYELLTLTERPGGARVPQTTVVDLAEEFREMQKPVTFSRALLRELAACLDRREQAIIFLNRRGFNTEVRCKNCGENLTCENCAISLTYHRDEKLLRCHYCDYATAPPALCPLCGSAALQFTGTGTERAEKIIGELLPAARLLRMDSDTMSGRDAHGKALTAFAAGEYDVLLGTQMVTKGFDFPRVTLVGVLAADGAINLPDFRAAEKTFQLITQVIGRAGRADKAGRAIIQAFQPEHYSVRCALGQNFDEFAQIELATREPLAYPPFGRLARIVVSGDKAEAARATAGEIGAALKTVAPKPGQILGPAPCVLEKLQGAYRFHLLVKAPAPAELRRILAAAANFYLINQERLQVSVDIDPLSMM
jgi:primosomal protein N' (replication factor Y)